MPTELGAHRRYVGIGAAGAAVRLGDERGKQTKKVKEQLGEE